MSSSQAPPFDLQSLSTQQTFIYTPIIRSNKMRKQRNFKSTEFSFNRQSLSFYGNQNSTFREKPSPTNRKSSHLDELKTKLSEYLRQKSFTKVHHPSRSQNIDDKNFTYNQQKFLKSHKYTKKQGLKINQLLENRLKKKKQEEKLDEDLQKMYRKSFTIRELRPEPKYKLTKQSLLADQSYTKMFGSYYQIVALHKNFDKSQYHGKSFQPHQFFNKTSNFQVKDMNDKGLLAENRPKKKEKYELRELKSYDGGIIDPWQNSEQNLIDILHD